ncbi:hypothetical protein TCAL_07856 [Tigriopus californicus]|uniref:Endonuclease/exonuclease/phosphatase domain-containing protein n=2 Tax=Tigriopus californicus TaxID=6832 RepID=A0A553PJB4_TIGCA|nr:hypothetical protein TCAL_07856 [Tigriopus californicus]
MNGYLHQIWYGDSWCGSGIGTAWIELPNGFKVLICTSHFHAEYNRDDDQFLPDRICQALEGIKEIESKEHLVDAVIYAGDFNTEPQDLPHQILIKMSGLQDARGNETPKPSYNAEWNTYASPKERPVTIDYIMIGTNEDTKVITTHCQNPLSSKISGESISYSDHEGVWAQIKFQDQKDIAYDKPEAYDVDTLNRLNSQLRDVLRLERSKMEWSMWIIFMVSAAFLSVWKWEGPWSIFIVLILSYLFYLGGQFFKRITAISSQIDTIMALMNPVKK